MAKAFGQLLHHFNGELISVVGSYWSRKLNGHSVIWDGGITRGMKVEDISWTTGTGRSTGLWSLGRGESVPKAIQAPAWWLNQLPEEVPLHGELWFNDQLEVVKQTVSCKVPSLEDWKRLKFMVFAVKPYCLFEGITEEVTGLPYYENNLCMRAYLEKARRDVEENQVLSFVRQTKLNSKQQVQELFQQFRSTNWEGIVFAKLDTAQYFLGRSYNVLKYKPEYEDYARVVGYEAGKTGRKIGLSAGLIVEYTWDSKVISVHGGTDTMIGKTVRFVVTGLTDLESQPAHLERLYPINSSCHFKFLVVSSHGVPQHTSIYRG